MDHPSDSGQPKSVRMLGDLGSGTGPVSGPVSNGKKVAHGVFILKIRQMEKNILWARA